MDDEVASHDPQKSKRQKHDRNRQIYFKLGFSKFWKIPIHRIIKKIKDSFDLSWLRVSMSYHKFSNLRECF